jgi:TRAP-type C4-dicarboxylate transport system permease small subunit
MSTNVLESPPDTVPGHRGVPSYGQCLGWLTDGLCGLAAACTVFVVLVQVASRLLGAPVSWSEELTRALFIWMIFIGMASSMRHAEAARVTIFLEKLPAPLRRLALPVYLAASIGFFALMGWTGLSMVRQQLAMNETIATLGWPSWVIGAVMPLSALLAILATVESLRRHHATLALEPSPDSCNKADAP